MIKLIVLFFFILINLNIKSFAESANCGEFKKFSVEYIKCKGNLIKDKSISTGQNIIKETKDYQEREWSDEKKKIEKAKKKANEVKKKVLEK
tara:strand:- start:1929 stop:2204 length:276 start_codon:yes stop_codon:yes gene_type:complete